MKALILRAIAGIVMFSLLALTMTACGGSSTKATASTPAASTAVVSTVAGQAGAKGSTDGSSAAARFNGPIGIVCDAAGNLYVADGASCTIRKITPAGQVTTLAGKAGAESEVDGIGTAARFDNPCKIARDAAGNLYVTDTGGGTVRKITPAGKVTTLAGKAGSGGSADGRGAAARFSYVVGIACDVAGNLYVADENNSTIRKITPTGEVTTFAGKAGSGGSADGRGAAASFTGPCGIACDATGNLYVTDGENSTIRKITPAREVTTLAGNPVSGGSADGRGAAATFFDPTGIACDAAGNLYVTDSGNCTIRKITPTGEVTTLAGTAGSLGSADGSGAAARFDDPHGIACDAAGDLYVADSGNNTIRKITLSH